MNKHLSVGILAHVDAGKTTLSEAILYQKGVTRTLGRVDHKDAFLDTHALERQRGITIFSKQAVFPLGELSVTLMDTPGHIDFSAETERTLQTLDYAIMVISAADGVTGHVMTLWRLLEAYQIPTFVFINKTDLAGTDLQELLSILSSTLNEGVISFDRLDNTFYEKAALCDEEALETLLSEGIIPDEMLCDLITCRKLFPVYSGSALKLEGVKRFLLGLERFVKPPQWPDQFGARVYKISRDSQGKRLTHLKMTGGTLSVRHLIGEEKITQLRIYNGAAFHTVNQVEAGQVCAVCGLESTWAGQGLGYEKVGNKPKLESLLSYQVLLPDGCDPHDAYSKLRILEEEIPELQVLWDEESRKIQVQLMGEVQMEILTNLLMERFSLAVNWGQPIINYRETITRRVEGVGHFEPLRHYAEVHLILEPMPVGTGILLETTCSEDLLDKNWQNLILTHLAERHHPGVLTGSPITDMKITLAAGKAHVKHTEGGDFRQATYRAVRHGLRRTDSVLLEPYYNYKLDVPTASVGRAMHDMQRIAGECGQPINQGDMVTLSGRAPVAAMGDYAKEVLAYTKGIGRLQLTFAGYFPCHNAAEVIEARGYDPDRDPANPCGSVFCSHGGGVNVPWEEVEANMHLPACLSETKKAADEIIRRTGSREYSDAELEAIFRKTYGDDKREKNRLKRDSRIVSARSMEQFPRVKSGYNDSQAPQILLIDGYNVIFAWEEMQEMTKVNLEASRALLIETLQNYQGYTGETIILVFDAYKQPGNIGATEKYGNLSVVYTKEGQTADQYIEKYVLDNVKKQKITVATSDGLEQMMIFGQGALRMPVRELIARVLDANEEIRSKYL
ncbi:NYN domain-containing protein [Ihubacter sp. rT4E-8]|uniref:NYN domain-containing protein n=1 Tax=Ihubacter sp. rT4E-8 TaxID=3242369 RepID=UPI003CF9214C